MMLHTLLSLISLTFSPTFVNVGKIAHGASPRYHECVIDVEIDHCIWFS